MILYNISSIACARTDNVRRWAHDKHMRTLFLRRFQGLQETEQRYCENGGSSSLLFQDPSPIGDLRMNPCRQRIAIPNWWQGLPVMMVEADELLT